MDETERGSRRHVMAVLRRDMARFRAAAAAIPVAHRDRPLVGDWTLADIVAHVAAWDRALTQGIDDLLAGRRPAIFDAAEQEEAFNARVVHAVRHRPFAEVEEQLRRAHERLLGRLDRLTDDEWRRPSRYRPPDDPAITVASLFAYRYRGATHYGGHAAELEAWRPVRSAPNR